MADMPWNDWLHITDGCEQGKRFPEAMEDGFLGVDERSFADLLAMGADFAAQLNMYTLRHQKDGTWAGLFARDATAVMASILGFRLDRAEGDFLRAFGRARDHQPLLRQLIDLAATIDGWYRKLEVFESAPAQSTARQLAAMIETKLAGELRKIEGIRPLSAPRGGDDGGRIFADFHPVWQTGTAVKAAAFDSTLSPSPAHGDDGEIRLQLHASFYALLNAVSALKKHIEAVLEETLSSGDHNPAMAMFMTFLRLYGKAQDRINDFHQRHLAFYYRRLLHLEPRPRTADSTYLVFRPIPGTTSTLIPAGTLFPAGADAEGRERIYRSGRDLLVSDVEVQALRTLFLQREQNISPEHELGYITRIYGHEIPLPPAGEISRNRAWPLFGAVRTEGEQPPGEHVRLGFALASPVLLLREGTRTVDIALVFTDYSTAAPTMQQAVERLSATENEQSFYSAFGEMFGAYILAGHDPLSPAQKTAILERARTTVSPKAYQRLAGLLLEDRQDVFYTLMQDLFIVELTGEAGWHRATGVGVRQIITEGKKNLDGLRFSFTLGPEVGPITAYVAGIHGAGYTTRLPLVRFRLNPRAHFFSCSLFDSMGVKEFQLTVDVRGINRIQACNNHGALDLSKPFQPFGPLPTDTSFLVFGSEEAACKPLTRLRLNIDWGDLPKDPEGFRAHYREYGRSYGNDSFVADLAILRDGRWQPGLDQSKGVLPLFATLDDGGSVSPAQTLEVGRLHHCQPIPFARTESGYLFSPQARDGFFKLTLAGPETAFGHKLYPSLLSETLTRNARSKLTRQQPLPQPPYTPVINQMTLDYTAHSVIAAGIAPRLDADAVSEKAFHLHPFGINTIRADADRRFQQLLPRFADDGNLLIGLGGNRPEGTLTLLFHLSDDSRRPALDNLPEIRWWYLASNRWHRMGDERILADTTNGFLVSGIVVLDIPADINRDNSIMPGALHWLRVSANEALDTFCSLVAVHTQAVEVTSLPEETGHEEEIAPRIDAGAITEARQSLPGIAGISQPLASFGGCEAEQPQRMNTRISERLRHKNRAVSPWDYERLVLQRFPEVFKVKCFSTLQSGEDRPQPGRVMLVAVPRQPSGDCLDFRPMLSAVELERIRCFVLERSSPFLSVEVRNPVYEQVQVRCSVVLTPEAQVLRGHALQQLNQALIDYLSPWSAIGYQARFGWEIRRTDLESYIRQQDAVAFVTRFSLLHITEERKDTYRLEDTARRLAETARAHDPQPPEIAAEGVISPHFPWSLAIPVARHAIEVLSQPRSLAPEAAGIDQLQVGQTFIIDS